MYAVVAFLRICYFLSGLRIIYYVVNVGRRRASSHLLLSERPVNNLLWLVGEERKIKAPICACR